MSRRSDMTASLLERRNTTYLALLRHRDMTHSLIERLAMTHMNCLICKELAITSYHSGS